MAAFNKGLFFLHVFLLSLHNIPCQSTYPTGPARFFDLVRESAQGDSLSNWDTTNNPDYCNLTGIVCDDVDRETIVAINITGWSLTGKFPDDVCSYLPKLRSLLLSHNNFAGGFPRGITNCSFLQELNTTHSQLTGPLPDFSPLKRTMRILDLSYNHFTGDFPMSVWNLTGLEALNTNENVRLNPWKLPETVSSLTRLRSMILTTCMLHGMIPRSLGNMTSLVDLELSGNFLVGTIPKEIGRLRNLRMMELYYNQLDGEVPEELGNLTGITDLDVSVNRFSGRIPESICRLPKIRVLQLYNNSLVGEIPEILANSTTLVTLSLYSNFLTGRVPPGLGRSSALVGVDLSENRLSGELPEGLCSGGRLKFLLMLQNLFSGEIPETYAECKSIVRFRVSSNKLRGKIPEGIFSLPNVSIIDMEKNDLTGSIPGVIGKAANLSELFMQGNRISGVIPPEISNATNLVKIDLSNNLLSGPIPSEIGNLKWLNLLLLQNNELNSSIPDSLSSLKSLNVLDLSSNKLTGKVPESLSQLLPNSLNFSNNRLSGGIPFPFIEGGILESFSGNPSLCLSPTAAYKNTLNLSICPPAYDKKRINCIWAIGVSIGIVIIGTLLFLRRWYGKNKQVYENDDTASTSFSSYDVKSFHRLSFDQREIVEAMVDKNIVGYGGSGTVYRIELNNGETVAVKKLWGRLKNKDANDHDRVVLDREMKAEVETLGSVRHKNIVKLYCYFSSMECSLLVYEYMPNGNLWDGLHGGRIFLDWPVRHQISLGVAQGLAYLHHDLMPPIVHRDIKSTNVLLDIDYLPKVADFGIAKVLQARGSKDSSSTTVIAGTYGYLAPEYAYSSKATTKCDVYSFGVLLMELLTGKKPVEPEFGENKNIIYWVSTKVETKEGATEVLDKRVLGTYKEDMIKVLRIAIRCTCRTPSLRPTMNEVVQLLMEADPCKFDCCNFSNKNKESGNVAKIKDAQFDL